jgi:hypothetical protein
MMSSSGSGAMAVLLSERRFSGGEGRGGCGGSGPWSGVGGEEIGDAFDFVLLVFFFPLLQGTLLHRVMLIGRSQISLIRRENGKWKMENWTRTIWMDEYN